ncbi:hypothetical protein HaLaN_18099, partial [Haematococcus lacustris]
MELQGVGEGAPPEQAKVQQKHRL